jgi:hypothetical protein
MATLVDERLDGERVVGEARMAAAEVAARQREALGAAVHAASPALPARPELAMAPGYALSATGASEDSGAPST